MGAEYIELKPKQESLAKARAVQGSDLKESEKFVVEADKPLLIDNYDVGEHGHYTVHLWGEKHETLGDSANIWPGHYESFPELLKVTQNTVLKKDPKKQSGELSASELMPARKGQLIIIRGAGEVVNKCVEVTLVTDDGKEDKWWAFLGDDKGNGHCSIVGTEPANNPTNKGEQKAPPKVDKGKTIRVPGISSPVYLSDGVDLKKAKNITWNEMTKGGTRIPPNSSITGNMIKIGIEIQKVRDQFGGKPCVVTSGYRPTKINLAVGGARFSRHTDPHADAADFYIQGVHVSTVYKHVNSYWGSKGGLAFSPGGGFVHIDLRGVQARWQYPY